MKSVGFLIACLHVLTFLVSNISADQTNETNEDDSIYFRIYAIGEEGQGRLISPDCDTCLSEAIKGVPTIFIAHGFNSDPFTELGNVTRAAFSARGEAVNMIFIDWSDLAKGPNYKTAADNVKPVGEKTAKMIDFLIENEVVSLSDIHYVGHSLGSHVANYVAGNLKSGKLPRIHALDPALPLFGNKEDNERIDPSDGEFVNVIHTAGGSLLEGGLSFDERRGHADFYPNGGKHQPGCDKVDLGVCKHGRAYLYFAESISTPEAFSGCECASWEEYEENKCPCENKALMGWATPNKTRGAYYLRTNSESPFGQG